MEFKDKLKQIRTENKLTQSQLAEKMFVSRSTIAKWENGLGLPTKESLTALATLFGIPEVELSTSDPETVIVDKNQKLHLWRKIISWAAILAVTLVAVALPIAIIEGNYGFTPDMAAGAYADREYIDTGDIRFYYFTFEGNLDENRHWSHLQGWKPIQKHWWGSTVIYDRMSMNIVTKNNYVVARLYSVKGKNGYYNLLKKAGNYKVDDSGSGTIWDIPDELICAESVSIQGQEYELENGFFFITQEPVRYFKINEQWFDVEE